MLILFSHFTPADDALVERQTLKEHPAGAGRMLLDRKSTL